jgi:hypothetical protein
MSSKYEDSMYGFYTQPDHFKTMLHVAEQAEWVTKQLLIDFYSKVKEQLQVQLDVRKCDWQVDFKNKRDARYVKLRAYKPGWCLTGRDPLLSIAIENLHVGLLPFIGIYIDSESALINGDTIKKEIASLKKIKEKYEVGDSQNWACWKYLNFNHIKVESLALLLPENRETTIENIITEYIDLIDLMEEDINRLLSDSTTNK